MKKVQEKVEAASKEGIGRDEATGR